MNGRVKSRKGDVFFYLRLAAEKGTDPFSSVWEKRARQIIFLVEGENGACPIFSLCSAGSF
jgi:hypothetical protein